MRVFRVSLAAAAAVCLLLLGGGAGAVNPGMKVRFTEKGMEYVADKALEGHMRALSTLPSIPGTSGNILGLQYKIGNAKLNFNGTSTSNVSVTSSGMTMSVQLGKIDVSIPYSGTFWLLFIPIAFEGTVTGSSGNVNVKQTIKLGATSAGKVSAAASDCTSSISGLQLTFTGGFDWIFNIFLNPFLGLTSFLLGPQICTGLDAFINIGLNGGLDAIPMKMSITNKIDIDYSLTGAPTYMEDYVDIGIKGEISESGSSTPSALTAAPLTGTKDTNAMLYIEVGEYMLGTLAETLYRTGALVYASRSPVASVRATAAPVIDFVPDGLNLTLAGRVDTTVNGTDVNFNMTSSLLMNASFADNTLKFGFGSPIVDTSTPSIPGFDVDAMINGGLLNGLIGQLNDAVGSGIRIPEVPRTSFNDSKITFGNASMVVAVDIVFASDLFGDEVASSYMPKELAYGFAVNADDLPTTTTTTPQPTLAPRARENGRGRVVAAPRRGPGRRPRRAVTT